MIGDSIPAVLQHRRGSISTLRALKQIKELLERLEVDTEYDEDRLNTSLDDIDTMIEKIL